MHLIVGLGNPGKQYENTRHNIGFMALEEIAGHFDFPKFQEKLKFFGLISEGILEGEKILFLKPQTCMNLSGKSIRAVLDFYKIPLSDMLIIHDDVDLKLGTYKITENSRSAGHRGVQNIIDTLGTQEFRRIRIGAGQVSENMEMNSTGTSSESQPNSSPQTDVFVLQKMRDEELKVLKEVFKKIVKEI